MSLAAAQPGRYSKLSWSTAFFMTLFHIGAVWALFEFTWSGLVVFLVTYYVSLALGHRDVVSPAADAPVVQDAEADRVFPDHLRHAGARRRPALLGGHAPQHHQHSDTDTIRTRRSTAGSGRTWAGSCSAMRCTTTTTITAKYAPDLGEGPVPRLDQQVSLDAADRARLGAAGARRLELGAVGRVPSHDARPARDLARELRDAPVGRAPIRDARRLAQQLVGGAPELRRRLAQQPPRASRRRPRTAWRGTRSTSPTCTSARSNCSASPPTSAGPVNDRSKTRRSEQQRPSTSRRCSEQSRPL